MKYKNNTNYFNQNGITLVALVITIVILLLLSGVTITMLLGQNGLIAKARTALNRTKISQYIEEMKLYGLEQSTDDPKFDIKTINVSATTGVQIKNGKEEKIDGIRAVIKSMPEEDDEFYIIENGELKTILTDDMTYQERKKLVEIAKDTGLDYVDETENRDPDDLIEELPEYNVIVDYITTDGKKLKTDKTKVKLGENITISVADKGYIITNWTLYDNSYEQKEDGRKIEELEQEMIDMDITIDCETYMIVTCQKPVLTIEYKTSNGTKIKENEIKEYSTKDTYIYNSSNYNIEGYDIISSCIKWNEKTEEKLEEGNFIKLDTNINIVIKYKSNTEYAIETIYVSQSENDKEIAKSSNSIKKGSQFEIYVKDINGYEFTGKIIAKDSNGRDIAITDKKITPTSNSTVTVYYNKKADNEPQKNKYTVSTSYVDQNGNTIMPPINEKIEEGVKRAVIKKTLGYKFDSISGTYDDGTKIQFNENKYNLTQNAEITVKYKKCNIYTLTKNYYDIKTSNRLREATTERYNDGEILDLNKIEETFDDYKFKEVKLNDAVINNITMDTDKTISVYYTKTVNITIEYIDSETDELLKDNENKSYEIGKRYSLEIPQIDGYNVGDILSPDVKIIENENDSREFIASTDGTISIYYSKAEIKNIHGTDRLVTVKLSESKFKPDDNVIVMHFNKSTGEKEFLCTCKVSEKNTVTFKVNSYSRFEFIKVDDTKASIIIAKAKEQYPNVTTATPTLKEVNGNTSIISTGTKQKDASGGVAVQAVTEVSVNEGILNGATEKNEFGNSYLFNIANYSSSAEGYVLKLGVESKYEGKTAILKYRTDAGEWITISTQTVSNSEITVSITNWSNYYYLSFTQNTSEETKEETKENLSNSPLYATLYTDGTLAFSNDNSEISGKTVVTKYGDISKLQLRESKVVDNINETEYHHPWLNAYGITEPMGFLREDYEQLNTKIKNAIKNITFVNKVSLNSTAYLFVELAGVTEISNLNYLDTSNVRDMSSMFGFCESLEKVEFNVLNTSRVTNMEGLFQGCIKLEEINMNGINTENVTDMSGMFGWCISLKKLDLSSFNTSNVADMSGMFAATKVLMDLSKFDTKNVTNMTAMFSGYQGTYLDLTSFNTKKVTDFHNMFDDARDLKHIIVDSGWNVSNQADVDGMFDNCGTNTVIYKKDIDTTITLNDYGFSNNHVYTEVGRGTTGFLFKPDKTIVAFSNGADQTAYFMQEFQASRMYWDVQNGKVVVVIEKTNGDPVILPVETSNNGRTITTINPFTQAQAEYYITLENYHEIYTGKKYNLTMSEYAGQYIIVNSDNTITLSSGLEQAGATATYLGQGCMIITLGSNTVYIATSIDGTKLLSTDGIIGAELEN